MKAMELVAPGCFELVVVPAPGADTVGPGEALVRVLAGGVCGSDLPYFKGHLPLWFGDRTAGVTSIPGFPLHEIVGEVLVPGIRPLRSDSWSSAGRHDSMESRSMSLPAETVFTPTATS
jgi:threonine dehydrogenase-like Zn-dependent dehydrogenase